MALPIPIPDYHRKIIEDFINRFEASFETKEFIKVYRSPRCIIYVDSTQVDWRKVFRTWGEDTKRICRFITTWHSIFISRQVSLNCEPLSIINDFFLFAYDPPTYVPMNDVAGYLDCHYKSDLVSCSTPCYGNVNDILGIPACTGHMLIPFGKPYIHLYQFYRAYEQY